ncbi:MAG: hypothetical protein Q7J34_11010 [Bacteroidales bacterium]|nr:hypothetical protein [Bacteroidales bacterium]
MAKGRKCPYCGYYMLAEQENTQAAGSWVVYVCRSCGHKEKVFEDK